MVLMVTPFPLPSFFFESFRCIILSLSLSLSLADNLFSGRKDSEGRWLKPERIRHSPGGMEQGNATIIGDATEIEIDALTEDHYGSVIPSAFCIIHRCYRRA